MIDDAGIDTVVIDEAGIGGDWSDDEDDGVDTSGGWVLSVEGNNKPVDAEFLPLDSACEEHTCPWNFTEGGRDLGPSNVQWRDAKGLPIPSGRKVMVSYDVLGPGGRVILHAQTPLCAERRQEVSSQCWVAHAEWRRSQVRRQELMD